MTTYLDACRTKRTRRAAAQVLIKAAEHWNWTVEQDYWRDHDLHVTLRRGPWRVGVSFYNTASARRIGAFLARWYTETRARETFPFMGWLTTVNDVHFQKATTSCATLEEFEAALSQGFKELDEHDAALEAVARAR